MLVGAVCAAVAGLGRERRWIEGDLAFLPIVLHLKLGKRRGEGAGFGWRVREKSLATEVDHEGHRGWRVSQPREVRM